MRFHLLIKGGGYVDPALGRTARKLGRRPGKVASVWVMKMSDIIPDTASPTGFREPGASGAAVALAGWRVSSGGLGADDSAGGVEHRDLGEHVLVEHGGRPALG
jgi:hypothetical protein